jgi:hypothetical protein
MQGFDSFRSPRIAVRAIHPPDEGYVADRIRFQEREKPQRTCAGAVLIDPLRRLRRAAQAQLSELMGIEHKAAEYFSK